MCEPGPPDDNDLVCVSSNTQGLSTTSKEQMRGWMRIQSGPEIWPETWMLERLNKEGTAADQLKLFSLPLNQRLLQIASTTVYTDINFRRSVVLR